MMTAQEYREKAEDMRRLAAQAESPYMRNHWAGLAAECVDLARRVEAEERYIPRPPSGA